MIMQTQTRRIFATYTYLDARGHALSRVIRYEPKAFKQESRDENGDWVDGTEGVERVLYRLPELLQASRDKTIFICEGEKATDALRMLSVVATTNVNGAGNWKDEYNKSLRGRHVVILPDNDKKGVLTQSVW